MFDQNGGPNPPRKHSTNEETPTGAPNSSALCKSMLIQISGHFGIFSTRRAIIVKESVLVSA